MSAKITTFERFKKSVMNSSKIIVENFSQPSLDQMIIYFNKKDSLDETYGKKPLRYLYDFINYNVDGDWLFRIQEIIKLGNSNCKEKALLKFGNIEGNKRWKEYCDFQARKNTFEYKKEKYGITGDEFNEYNNTRSNTLLNFIKRHGDIDGAKLWDDYVKRQAYTTTLEYFVSEYGETKGTTKYNDFVNNRPSFATNNQRSINFKKSNMEMALLLAIAHLGVVPDVKVNDERYYAPFDMGVPDKKKLIEFYGDYWHMNPEKYLDTYIHPVIGITAKHKHALDATKVRIAKDNGYDTLIIWESEWLVSKELVIRKVKEFLDETRNNK
jgi:G:T-mismatch repair DNA endonuclease (very short patch repair protein)